MADSPQGCLVSHPQGRVRRVQPDNVRARNQCSRQMYYLCHINSINIGRHPSTWRVCRGCSRVLLSGVPQWEIVSKGVINAMKMAFRVIFYCSSGSRRISPRQVRQAADEQVMLTEAWQMTDFRDLQFFFSTTPRIRCHALSRYVGGGATASPGCSAPAMPHVMHAATRTSL